MIGIVLAAGAGRRLAPLTDDLPKTLLQVDGATTILDIALSNFAAAGVTDIHVVTGFASHQVESRLDDLQQRHGVKLTTIFNDKALVWNNAYSLWLARELFAEGVLVCNGDTVHPASVEKTLLSADASEILLALDDQKQLAEEEMKVTLGSDGMATWINKAVNPAEADGEYIGVSRIEPAAASRLADALEAAWERDPNFYYEDGFQIYLEAGGKIEVVPIGAASWIEVDNTDDLARAREIACHY